MSNDNKHAAAAKTDTKFEEQGKAVAASSSSSINNNSIRDADNPLDTFVSVAHMRRRLSS